MEVGVADTLADGWHAWRDRLKVVAPEHTLEITAVEEDGRYLGYVRVVPRRRAAARLDEPIVSVPTKYVKKPLLRNGQ